jgi:hypothetical protein
MHQSLLQNSALLGAFFFTVASGCAAQIREQRNAEPSLTRREVGQLIPGGIQGAEPREKASDIVVHIDPKSGEFTSAPSGPMPTQGPQQSLEKAGDRAAELQETLSPVPGGGVMIDLGERSFTPLTATIDADGKVRLEHVPSQPDSRDK